ncbi:Heat shock 70 kDa protein 1-like [Linum perenne]
MILGEMKETVEFWLGNPIVGVMVTFPAYFNNTQRQATNDVDVIIGLRCPPRDQLAHIRRHNLRTFAL